MARFVGDKPLGNGGSEDTISGPRIAQSPKARHGEGDQGRCCAPALCSCKAPASAALRDSDQAGGTPAWSPAWQSQGLGDTIPAAGTRGGEGGGTASLGGSSVPTPALFWLGPEPLPVPSGDALPCGAMPCHGAHRDAARHWRLPGAEGGLGRVSSTPCPIWIILYILYITVYSSLGSLLPVLLYETLPQSSCRCGRAVRCGSSPSPASSCPCIVPKSPLLFPLENFPFCSAFEGILSPQKAPSS